MYVIEFPFNKIVRLHTTAYYRLKNLGVLKILENVMEMLKWKWKMLCYGVPFSKLQVFKLASSLILHVFKILENS